jgi:hypothetical protein
MNTDSADMVSNRNYIPPGSFFRIPDSIYVSYSIMNRLHIADSVKTGV